MVPTPFKRLVVATSGSFRSYKQATLKQIVEDGGGTFIAKVTDECTHLIITPKEVESNSTKFQQASALKKCHIVSLDWLLNSVNAKKKLPENQFRVNSQDKDDGKAADTDKKRPAAQSDAVDDGVQGPPSKKKREDSVEEKKKKLTIPVDEVCKVGADYDVLIDEEGTIWDASLNLTSSSNNNNKFYRIQLLKAKKKSDLEYCSWTRWGRVGEMGTGALIGPCTFEIAKKSFEKKFREKSGLPWKDRLGEPKADKYSFVELDYEDDDEDDVDEKNNKKNKKKQEQQEQQPKTEENQRPPPESTLPKPVQNVVAFIFNQEYAMTALQDLNFDANKMPLGKLSKRTLQTGFQVLKDLSELLNDHNLAATKYKQGFSLALETLSNRYFTIIPHAFGRSRPPVINQSSILRKEVELLDNLTDMEIANQILSDSLVPDDEVHFLDKQFQGLRLDEMSPLSHKSTEFSEIEKYLLGSHGPTHGYSFKCQDIFRIERNGELERFDEAGMSKIANDNRRLLWHGSRSTNFGGILSQGLRIAPPEAPVNGYMFGKGVYFADISSKSAGYCCSYSSKNTGLLLLCEVQLGDPMQELENASYTAGEDAKKNGKLATLGLGRTVPLGWKDAGCIHSSLQGVSMPDTKDGLGDSTKGGTLLYNEYIVYDVAQIRQRYLLKVRFG